MGQVGTSPFCEYIGRAERVKSRAEADVKHSSKLFPGQHSKQRDKDQPPQPPYQQLDTVEEYPLDSMVSDWWLEESAISDDMYFDLRKRVKHAKGKEHVYFSFRLASMITFSMLPGTCVVNQTEFLAEVYVQSSKAAKHLGTVAKCPESRLVQRLKPKLTRTRDLYGDEVVTAVFELPVAFCSAPVEYVEDAVAASHSWTVLPKWCDVCDHKSLFVTIPAPGKQGEYDVEKIFVDSASAAACKDNPYGWGTSMGAGSMSCKGCSLGQKSKDRKGLSVAEVAQCARSAQATLKKGDKMGLGFEKAVGEEFDFWNLLREGVFRRGYAYQLYPTVYTVLKEYWLEMMQSYFPWVSRLGVLGTLAFVCSFLVAKYIFEGLGTEVWPQWLVSASTLYRVFSGVILAGPYLILYMSWSCVVCFYELLSDILDNMYLFYLKYLKRRKKRPLGDDVVEAVEEVYALHQPVLHGLYKALSRSSRGPAPMYFLPLNSLFWFLFFPAPWAFPWDWLLTSLVMWEMLPHNRWQLRATVCMVASLIFLLPEWEGAFQQLSVLFLVAISYLLQAPTGAWAMLCLFYWCEGDSYLILLSVWCAVKLLVFAADPKQVLLGFWPWPEHPVFHNAVEMVEEGLIDLGMFLVYSAVNWFRWDPVNSSLGFLDIRWWHLLCMAAFLPFIYLGHLPPYFSISWAVAFYVPKWWCSDWVLRLAYCYLALAAAIVDSSNVMCVSYTVLILGHGASAGLVAPFFLMLAAFRPLPGLMLLFGWIAGTCGFRGAKQAVGVVVVELRQKEVEERKAARRAEVLSAKQAAAAVAAVTARGAGGGKQHGGKAGNRTRQPVVKGPSPTPPPAAGGASIAAGAAAAAAEGASIPAAAAAAGGASVAGAAAAGGGGSRYATAGSTGRGGGGVASSSSRGGISSSDRGSTSGGGSASAAAGFSLLWLSTKAAVAAAVGSAAAAGEGAEIVSRGRSEDAASPRAGAAVQGKQAATREAAATAAVPAASALPESAAAAAVEANQQQQQERQNQPPQEGKQQKQSKGKGSAKASPAALNGKRSSSSGGGGMNTGSVPAAAAGPSLAAGTTPAASGAAVSPHGSEKAATPAAAVTAGGKKIVKDGMAAAAPPPLPPPAAVAGHKAVKELSMAKHMVAAPAAAAAGANGSASVALAEINGKQQVTKLKGKKKKDQVDPANVVSFTAASASNSSGSSSSRGGTTSKTPTVTQQQLKAEQKSGSAGMIAAAASSAASAAAVPSPVRPEPFSVPVPVPVPIRVPTSAGSSTTSASPAAPPRPEAAKAPAAVTATTVQGIQIHVPVPVPIPVPVSRPAPAAAAAVSPRPVAYVASTTRSAAQPAAAAAVMPSAVFGSNAVSHNAGYLAPGVAAAGSPNSVSSSSSTFSAQDSATGPAGIGPAGNPAAAAGAGGAVHAAAGAGPAGINAAPGGGGGGGAAVHVWSFLDQIQAEVRKQQQQREDEGAPVATSPTAVTAVAAQGAAATSNGGGDGGSKRTATARKMCGGGVKGMCAVCMCEPCSVLLLPCRHLALCRGCSPVLEVQGSGCPLCQQVVDKHLVVHRS